MAKATRTINPLHFEDLEPHRFEDLVRRLLYSFREWTNIEPTGRSGTDDGFDARAYEKGDVVANVGDEGEEGVRPLSERIWQIQIKREKVITPGRLKTIIEDSIDSKQPPYGFLLAAATNISKTSFDVFRAELKRLRVVEFYFWGKDYLEDQLALPQNDEILFTFFGLSLSPQRRSRIAELKFGINNKNKIQKILFGSDSIQSAVHDHRSFLLRDAKDAFYPDAAEYADFEKRRRWEEHRPVHITARGVYFRVREWYAYWDKSKREWDFTRAVDLTPRQHNIDRSNRARLDDHGKSVEQFWRHLPLDKQAKLVVFGFVKFDDILLVDEKGDSEYSMPHIFVDFGDGRPFSYTTASLQRWRGQDSIGAADFEKHKRIKQFPETYEPLRWGRVLEVADLKLQDALIKGLQTAGAQTLYGFDSDLDQVKVGDILHAPARDSRSSDTYIEIMRREKTNVGAFLNRHKDERDYRKSLLQRDAGRDILDSDKLTILEAFAVSTFDNGASFHYHDSTF